MPGAPAAAPAAPAEPTKAEPKAPEASTTQSDQLTASERAELDRLRAVHKEEGKWENRSKANAKKLRDLAVELGVDPAEFNPSDFDPKAELGKLREDFNAERTARLRAEIARTEQVDPDVLTGNTEEEMRAAAQRHKTLVAKAVEDALAAAGKTPPSAAPASTVTSSERIEGPTQVTREELKGMTPQQILAADKEGRLNQLKGKST
ncbi:hypothetical protein CG716_09875 [Mycolicibacterium sphagni]|uniref:Scaffolding protein n=2 Tax=Mycolicibacterium sphagni TaxID=1786 RepID=A0A255DN11_9MYCO|nr:hypothetical protein CG716_09875 [Mycolicibacterium sphagni]